MLKELEELQRQAESELKKSKTEEEFLAVKTKYLGRKGILASPRLRKYRTGREAASWESL